MSKLPHDGGEIVPFKMNVSGNLRRDEIMEIFRQIGGISTHLQIQIDLGEDEPTIELLYEHHLTRSWDKIVFKRAYNRLHTVAVQNPDFPLKSVDDENGYYLVGDPQGALEWLQRDETKPQYNKAPIALLSRYLSPDFDLDETSAVDGRSDDL